MCFNPNHTGGENQETAFVALRTRGKDNRPNRSLESDNCGQMYFYFE